MTHRITDRRPIEADALVRQVQDVGADLLVVVPPLPVPTQLSASESVFIGIARDEAPAGPA